MAHRRNHIDCSASAECAVDLLALARWPGIDRHALARCRHDPKRIARLVARGSSLPIEAIRALLEVSAGPRVDEASHWFG